MRKRLKGKFLCKLDKGPLKGHKVFICSAKKIKALDKYVDRVLDAMGFPGAMVTDESSTRDFAPLDFRSRKLARINEKQYEEMLRRAQAKLGIKVGRHDYLWDVARRLKEKDEQEAEQLDDVFEEPSSRCSICKEPYEVVRPGKEQPTCDCDRRCNKCGGLRKCYVDPPKKWPRSCGYICPKCGPGW